MSYTNCVMCGQPWQSHGTICRPVTSSPAVSITVAPVKWSSQRDAMASSIATFREQLEQHIREWWGERCEDFDPDCFCCQKWKAFDEVTENNMEPAE